MIMRMQRKKDCCCGFHLKRQSPCSLLKTLWKITADSVDLIHARKLYIVKEVIAVRWVM